MVTIPIVSPQEEINNSSCSLPGEGRPLTCDYNGKSYENPVDYFGPNTYSLILKNSESLHLYPETHESDAYKELASYQLIEISDLEIEPYAFANLRDMRYMHIINNNWKIIKDNTFANMSKLELLIIANDSVEEVQANAFKGLTGLDTLEITNNKIAQLPRFVFRDLKKVTSLLLHHNEMEVLEDGVLEGLKELRTLDLSHNKLTVLKTSDINKLSSLTHLYLSHNRISQVDGVFKAPSLGVIYFQNNKLQQIRDDLFEGAVTLRGIDLSGNDITELSDVPFKNLRSLTYLNVARNKINDFSKLKQLKALATYK